ncbi:hypothetical protein POL68_01075 [Stigmatella sp. ncwal1]|uniref:Uncharacterized protein n=1 Tax=Stigmatella ashevillensis TaxID=2995309 RepID=A0ABT5D050_9BACT|nr:hypothetical protein [Stigmatella ashevillena]MDC0707052.1 hypothetical protein [Stigmatella ashevillena]
MGWVESLIFRDWPRPGHPSQHVVDLLKPRVCGLPLGAAAAQVRETLGAPASWREKRRGCWAYPSWGLRVDVPADRELDSFSIALSHSHQGLTASRLPWQPFSGQLLLPGRSVPASRVTPLDFETALSTPATREEVFGDTVLTWNRGGWLLEVSFAPGGAPLYAHVQRAAG